MKWAVVAFLVLSVLHIHFRGRVRLPFGRQLFDHSSFMAPINIFMHLFSRVPNTPYIPVEQFPDLVPLQQNWQVIRKEAENLVALQKIKAAENNDDAGFNSFFKNGWKRFYLKWYDASHPSAERLCPETYKLLQSIPSVKAAMFAELATRSPARCVTTWAWRRQTMTAASSKSMASRTAGVTARV
jgi:beta-hydroxylase